MPTVDDYVSDALAMLVAAIEVDPEETIESLKKHAIFASMHRVQSHDQRPTVIATSAIAETAEFLRLRLALREQWTGDSIAEAQTAYFEALYQMEDPPDADPG